MTPLALSKTINERVEIKRKFDAIQESHLDTHFEVTFIKQRKINE